MLPQNLNSEPYQSIRLLTSEMTFLELKPLISCLEMMKWMPMTGLCRLCRVVLGVEVLLVVHSLLSIEESQIDAFDVTKIIYK